jgi:hypothetical protein
MEGGQVMTAKAKKVRKPDMAEMARTWEGYTCGMCGRHVEGEVCTTCGWAVWIGSEDGLEGGGAR